MKKLVTICVIVGLLSVSGLFGEVAVSVAATASQYQTVPPFLTAGVPPLVMLVMGRNHKFYYEAYNDASDLNGDGVLDVGYNPDIDYYGYFDCYKCYTYNSGNSRFEPSSITTDKKCSAADEWSGDFLNYLTMSRMDCMRKVLYGGYRSTDTATETVLQRVYVPQDAHSWGKEYESIGKDGYDIRDYTPWALPAGGMRHLFASTTLSDNGDPLLRVLTDSDYRIWEWVSIERPVAGLKCLNGTTGPNCATAGGTVWEIVPPEDFTNLIRTTYDITAYIDQYPQNQNEYDTLVSNYANSSYIFGSGTAPNINGEGNPFGSDEKYLTIFEGKITIPEDGSYTFAVDGDDAVEVIIDATVVAGWYGAHGSCNCQSHTGTIYLTAGQHDIVFRHEEAGGADNYYLYWQKTIPPSVMTDYVVRVKVADPSMPESNCKQYPSGVYKPIGILQRHGESERMYFGLITGSYVKNITGGVLRKNIHSIVDEIDPDTGEFEYQDDSSIDGIVKTIDKLRISGFQYTDYAYSPGWPAAWVVTRGMSEGEFPDWGNPVGEMLYEGLRYFAGKATPTGAFDYSGGGLGIIDNELGLPKASWVDPYTNGEDLNTNGKLDPGEDLNGNGLLDGFGYCAKPFMLVLSDINPTFDSDQLPGSYFSSFSGDVSGLNVENLANTISADEGVSGSYYIGEDGGNYNGSCSPKAVTGFGDIRGLCEEEPTKQGSYYSASVAHFGRTEDVSAAQSTQNINTYVVGLASPLPRINIPVGDDSITLVPFAKSVGGRLGIQPGEKQFQPTNTIVDFYVEEITPTYGKIRINFEDVEQGADHDMDAIVKYEYQVINAAGDPVSDPANGAGVDITLNSIYAAGCNIQHIGYIISGTTADGTYLEVRDMDLDDPDDNGKPIPEGSVADNIDVDYFLDTPNDNAALPLTTTRTFTVGTTTAATLLENPLWYAAKWGGFEDSNSNNKPDLAKEWDKDSDGVPDTYFYVTNPLKLEEQLNKSFADILRRTSSGTAASVISNSRSGEGAIYQSIFFPEYKGPLGNSVSWCGEVYALLIDAYGNMREDTNGNKQLDLATDKIIVFDGTTVYKYGDDDGDSEISGDEETPDEVGSILDIRYLWTTNEWLNEISDTDIVDQRTYDVADNKRYIFTFVDTDQDMVVDSGEQAGFTCSSLPPVTELSDPSKVYPYLTLYPSFGDEPAYVSTIRTDGTFDDFLQNQTQRVINYVRGEDQSTFASSTTPTYAIPAFRNRKVDYDEDDTLETWRLGDIVYSTPTFVGRPSEGYHLLYRDLSYGKFVAQYMRRRGVVYVGGNDGMFHAFNAGFYDPDNKKFLTQPLDENGDPDTDFAAHDLGAELWAYVPYNLLPHLYWLTEPSYGHSYYSDLKPRIFDAKIFADDAPHPGGWGTVLVAGMRFGGGEIAADMDKTDGASFVAGTDRTMTSAYIIFDITDPEQEPRVLAEISFTGLGYTTCYPGVIPMKNKNLVTGDINANDWYLVLGSGPAEAGGTAGIGTALSSASSSQPAKLYLIDLVKLATDAQLWTLNDTGVPTTGENVFQELDMDYNSFISDPISVDYNLDYNADAVYFGTVSGDHTNGWGGKLRRIEIKNDLTTSHWEGDSTLIDLTAVESGQPITAAPSVGIDCEMNRWVFFGTGRFFDRNDANNSDQQTYYGTKEPLDSNGDMTWAEITSRSADLLDVSNAEVFTDEKVTGVTGVTNWDELLDTIRVKKGWFLNFSELKERNLSQATLLGGVLNFTTYVPSLDPCEFEGEGYLYALYYITGTAYYESVIGTLAGTQGQPEKVLPKLYLGKGVPASPAIFLGGGGERILTPIGPAITNPPQESPGITMSGVTSWQDGCR